MSVLIRGMEMPTRCGRCDMCIREADGDIDYHYECCITAATIENLGEKMEDCPLVPVPPHGRLGDLDKLVEKIDGIWDCNDMVFKPNDHCCNVPEDCKGCKWAQTKDCIQRMVENAPTIIEAEEVYGRYTDTAGNFHWCGTHSGEHTIKAEEGE